MANYIIECPACKKPIQAGTGLFSKKRLRCSCGYLLDVSAERFTHEPCPHCGNDVIYDRTKSKNASCPVCHTKIHSGLDIDSSSRAKLIETFLNRREWDEAQQQINELLKKDVESAEANWYSTMCSRKATDDRNLFHSWPDFSTADQKKLDAILSNSSPEFAKRIIDAAFDEAYLNDDMCSYVFATVLPYARNEAVYSKKQVITQVLLIFR